MRRVYRLRRVLESRTACVDWRNYVVGFTTFDELIADINAQPEKPVPSQVQRFVQHGRAFWARWFAYGLACSVGGDEAWWYAHTWDYAVGGSGCCLSGPITDEERDRFLVLWKIYADKHGLYEEVES